MNCVQKLVITHTISALTSTHIPKIPDRRTGISPETKSVRKRRITEFLPEECVTKNITSRVVFIMLTE